MKSFKHVSLPVLVLLSFSALFAGIIRGQAVPFTVGFYYPTNGQTYAAPATVGLHALVLDSNVVKTVQYFANSNSIGIVTNKGDALFTNSTQSNPFFLTLSNVATGAYSLTAIATDAMGISATSAIVNITVTNPIVHPDVYIYSPSNGASFLAPTNLTLYARAAESAGTIATVQFFANDTNIGVVSNSSQMIFTNISTEPLFALAWPNVPPGSYALKAVATDTLGNTATSSVITITARTNTPPPNIPFTVSFFYPTNGQTYAAPATVGLHALVLDSNIVRTVQYFANSNSIGTVTNSGDALFTNSTQGNPFFLSWSNVAAGAYSLTAVATDAMGISATSATVNITVTNPVVHPSVYIYSPTNGASFLAPTNLTLYARAAESAGTIAAVQFFANDTNIGVVSNSSQMFFTNISSEPLFALAWPNVPPGSYALKAVATDTLGNTGTSSVVTITVRTNTPPPNTPFTVSFFYPTNGQSYIAPASIGLHALVLDSNIVRTVQYFANSNSIGTVTNSGDALFTNSTQGNPFFLSWSNVAVGAYSLTAVATDAMGISATSATVNITVTNPVVHPAVYIYSPTNGASFLAPTNLTLYTRAAESAGTIATVQFFANDTNLGVVSNSSQMVFTNISTEPLFALAWPNVPAGTYALRAVATDTSGNTGTSSVVTITIRTNTPPPNIPFTVSFYYPTNGQSYIAPASIGLHALVLDSNIVKTVQYFANSNSIGTVTNTGDALFTNSTLGNPFFLSWSNVATGAYSLTAVATDAKGFTATSAPINITVTNAPPPHIPFVIAIVNPENGQKFVAPANISIRAVVVDSNVVETVQYFANCKSIGIVTNTGNVLLTNTTQSNPFSLTWSNVPVRSYALTAVATDSTGNTATSGPVNIYVLSNLPPVVSIYATDPVAVEGTNYTSTNVPPVTTSNYVSGANTASFVVHRDGTTNTDLTVYYSIGGTASNGVDYAALPGSVTIPAGKSYAVITIIPLKDDDSAYRSSDTVVLSLIVPPVAAGSTVAYSLGSSRQAAAVILEEDYLPIPHPMIRSLADTSLHVSLPATNGMNFCLQISTDLVNWSPVCTNTVLKGSAQYVDPAGTAASGLFYRIVPVAAPASY